MEQPDLKGQTATQAARSMDESSIAVVSGSPSAGIVSPPPCPTCGTVRAANNGPGSVSSYVYALGKIGPRFPTPSVEKEFAQVVGRHDTKGFTDPQVLNKILSERHNRYLVRKLCWVMTIESLETYLLVPRDPADFDLLVESLRATPQPGDLDLVIGVKGPIASPEMCNGLMVPIVAFDQIYSFDRDSLIKAIPTEKGAAKKKTSEQEFTTAAEVLLDRVLQMTDNAGATDEHRALNYLAVRHHRIYKAVADAFARGESLSAAYVQPSPLSSTRNVVEVIFSFTNRETNVVDKQFVRVDVTEEFPFLVTNLSPYYDMNH